MDIPSIQNNSREESIHCFATHAIFEKRANSLRKWTRSLTFLGVALPGVVGLSFVSYGADSKFTTMCLIAASVLGLIQFVLSVWSLAQRWDDSLGYALESMTANRDIGERFQKLAKNPPKAVGEANLAYEIIQTESQSRSRTDDQQGVTLKEKRYGMRSALRQLGMECAGCKEVPLSMRAAECDVCGNF